MGRLLLTLRRSILGLLVAASGAAHAAEAGAAASSATLERTEYLGVPAFRLSDGRTEAVIVPQFSGRVMRYGPVGGRNWLWNSPAGPRPQVWSNLGGDKAFIGPHPDWKQFAARIWPPPFPSWDGAPHEAVELPGARLRTTGPVWDGFGARIVREFFFEETGAFVVEQTVEKGTGAPLFLAAWTVSQLAPPDAVFLPLNPASAYARGFHAFGKLPPDAALERLSPRLLRVTPTTGRSYKIGADAPVAALAARRGREVWVQRAPIEPGNYPDGAEGAGFPIEFYNHGAAGAEQYVELEMLSPQRALSPGERLTLSVRWSLHTLATADPAAADAELDALLQTAPPARSSLRAP